MTRIHTRKKCRADHDCDSAVGAVGAVTATVVVNTDVYVYVDVEVMMYQVFCGDHVCCRCL